MNEAEQEDSAKFNIGLCAGTDLVMDEQKRFNGGYLFFQDIYYELGLHKICRAISGRHLFEYDLNDILSRLIYTRILYPSSKRSSFEDSKRFLKQPWFELHDIYRALSVLAEESDYIQIRLFKNSTAIQKRNTQVIYYDCTTFILKLMMLGIVSSLERVKRNVLSRSWERDYSWTWTISPYPFPFIPGTGTSRLP